MILVIFLHTDLAEAGKNCINYFSCSAVANPLLSLCSACLSMCASVSSKLNVQSFFLECRHQYSTNLVWATLKQQ